MITPHVLSFAARNHRGRFYIPTITNFFNGIQVRNVLFDTGCSSLLLRYPLDTGFPADFMQQGRYEWKVLTSRGTGAVHSLVLIVRIRLGAIFPLTLASKQQAPSLNWAAELSTNY